MGRRFKTLQGEGMNVAFLTEAAILSACQITASQKVVAADL
jgi:hypothetical protein